MAYTTIDDPTIYFNTKLYTGNATDNTGITGVGFQPDWTWLKDRTNANHHRIYDSVRGATKVIYSSLTNAEGTASTGLKSFDSDGFTLGTGSDENGSSANFVSWNWLASNTTASNTDGSITSTVSANTTAGFSICSWTGTAANATVGHGLGQALDMVIVKNRDDADDWITWHNAFAGTEFIRLNVTNAKQTAATRWNSTIPTSSVFSLGSSNGSNGSSDDMIAYCFAEKKGYSKFGNYTGNGGSSGVNNADGTFVFTGFSPAWIMIKRTDSAQQWGIADSKRDVDNPVQHHLFAESNQADSTSSYNNFDFLSNGFKLRSGDQWTNASGGTYIYMAFAESPFVSSGGIPCTAR